MVETQFFITGSEADPVVLRNGSSLPGVTLAYETYGELNRTRDNAVLVFHALTGSQHVAGHNRSVSGIGDRWTEEMQIGWWDAFVGPGKAFDTNEFFVVCANYVGGCYGSTGPASIDPRTNRPFGSTFPSLSLADMVDLNVKLLEHLGIERLHAVTGGSIGGVMSISLATRYPDLVHVVMPIAAGLRVTALQTIHNFEQINAIQNDPHFKHGDYYGGPAPDRGLMLARMIGHKTFVSLEALEERARAEVVRTDHAPDWYQVRSPLESYMWHQGSKFVQRFDANSYLRIMEAWQSFDLAAEAGRDDLADLFTPCKDQQYMVFTIDSDVCFYPDEQSDLVSYLKLCDVPHRRITVHSDKGHDSFLLEPDLFAPHIRDVLATSRD